MTYRYARRGSIAPPWDEIHATDTERKQSFEEAVRTSDRMAKLNEECGYEVLGLPLCSPEQRAEFILQRIG